MRIKQIKLHNIRSYDTKTIKLPQGTTLLCGDVGSGKTSILLGVEFALFGLQPGLISGQDLLRHGTEEGFVEIELELHQKSIKIKRTLQRKKQKVLQGKGRLELDGKAEELGPEELKDRVLKLLGYPRELLKKANLLYRFTLYTPQEQMRQILLEKADERLDTLRRIFGVDKYRAIVNNSELVASKLRTESRIKEAEISDLLQKKENFKALQEERAKLEQEIEKLREEHKKVYQKLEAKQAEINKLKLELKELNLVSSALAKKEAELKAEKENFDYLNKKIMESKNRIAALEKVKPAPDVSKQLEENIKTEQFLREQISNFEKIITQLKADQEHHEKIKQQVLALKRCPTCKQVVSEKHKTQIASQADQLITKAKLELDSNIQELSRLRQKLEQVLQVQNSLRQQEKAFVAFKTQLEQIEDWKQLLTEYEAKTKLAKERIQKLIKEIIELKTRTKNFQKIQTLYETLEKEQAELQETERKAAIECARQTKQLESLNEQLEALKKEIEVKETKKQEVEKLKEVSGWLLQCFIPLVLRIEQAVMATLHKQFNSLFEKWFGALVDGLQVRVDESFTPIIEQQGYEVSYDALSGGERTAVALAYRLALNTLINSTFSKIATKGVLILDEPTDGFSSEQLDKLRDVLQELKTEQLILVSHEAKVESFVENIIRIKKHNYLTQVVS